MKVSKDFISSALNKRQSLIFLTIAILFILMPFYRWLVLAKKPAYKYLTGPHLSKSDRILIIAPHPDDECIGTAGIIIRAVKNHIPLKIVLFTNGDGYIRGARLYFRTFHPNSKQFKELGIRRHNETLQAMKTLGVKRKDIIFLSYPDGSLNSLFSVNWDYNKLHLGLNGEIRATYPFSYKKDAPYCGKSLEKNLEEIIRKFRPTKIFYPDPGDNNHDHWAASALVEYTLCKMNYMAERFNYLVHKGFEWPFPWAYEPELELLPPASFIKLDAKWYKFPLTEKEEKLKHKALTQYVSQIEVKEPFLDAFVRKNELFAQYPDLRYDAQESKPLIIKDPEKDSLTTRFNGSADITSLKFEEKGRYAVLTLNTRGKISDKIIYVFHIIWFEDHQAKRLDLKVFNNRASCLTLNSEDQTIAQFSIEKKDREINVKLPKVYLGKAGTIMLAADAFSLSYHRIDRTAYRTATLSKI